MREKLRGGVQRFGHRLYALAICTLLALIGLVGSGALDAAFARPVDVGTNPTPKIDIAVNKPDDYAGTFEDFKSELTEKLLSQGLNSSDFRITDTKILIDTTNLTGWHVYDHYLNDATYNSVRNAMGNDTAHQPYRATVGNFGSPATTVEAIYKNNGNSMPGRLYNEPQSHIWSSTDSSGRPMMVFAGYYTTGPSLVDYMIYPATSNGTRNFSFDLDSNFVNTHTMKTSGFLLNAGIDGSGNLVAYALRVAWSSKTSGTLSLVRLPTANAAGYTEANIEGGTVVASQSISLSSGRANMKVELNKNNVTVQMAQYNGQGVLGDYATVFGARQNLADTGYNGFGPFVGYATSGHTCDQLGSFVFSNLEMSYATSSFDALKLTQYYEQADYKYFINLVGDSGDPDVPDVNDPSYADGIKRMNVNEIFYVSNGNDGRIVKEPTDEVTALGQENGYYAVGEDYVTEMASYIANNYKTGHKFQQGKINSDIPLANFYMTNTATGDQLMTVHLMHLTGGGTVSTNFFDKSMTCIDDHAITNWQFRVLDPENIEVYNSGKVSDPNQIKDYTFTGGDANGNGRSKSGKYIFELTVWDSAGHESKASQTYITAYLDDQQPLITASNTSERNSIQINFTDTGEGIDEDGITFIRDGRGSGVRYYWLNDTGENREPTDEDWVEIPVQHSFDITHSVNDTEPFYVWVKDECGNVGEMQAYQPTRVVVQDEDGNVIDDYYTVEEKPVVFLPEEDILPDPEDPDKKFSGWTVNGGDIPDGTDITEGTDVPPTDDHEIVIRPNYSVDQAILSYLPNGGAYEGNKTDPEKHFVTAKSSIIKDVSTKAPKPTREGYTFTGWKLLNTNVANWTYDEAYANNPANLSTVAGQVANASENRGREFKDGDYYYLVAQWQIGHYTLRLDANGGGLNGVTSKFENVRYGQNLADATDITDGDGYNKTIPVSGKLPERPGCIFVGWSTTANRVDDFSNTFLVATGQSIAPTQVAQAAMPARDTTVYAVWKTDPNKFTVTFDANGGTGGRVHAYAKTTPGNYLAAPTPQNPGYEFKGWYLADADNQMTDSAYSEGTAITNKANHTYLAKWEAIEGGSRYFVDLCVNNGATDDEGNPVYVAQSAQAQSHAGTAGVPVAIDAADAPATIEVNGATYWFNADATSNLYEGVVKGDGTLRLRYCYDRFFDVNVTANDLEAGTVTSALDQREGTTPSVSWKANEGWHVKQVTVDGVVRDDLRTKDGFTVESPLKADVNVRVVFEKDTESTPAPTDPVTPKPENTYYSIKTRVEGTTDSDVCTITPSFSVKMGSEATVEWTLKDNSRYRIAKVTVDGEDVDSASGNVAFHNVDADHDVVVTLTTLPSLGGSNPEVDHRYTLTVNRYGGDDKVKTSKTVSVAEGEKASPNWDATESDWQIVKVVVDGEDVTATKLNDKTLQKINAYNQAPFNKGFTSNHVVDIYMAMPETDDEGNPVDPVVPDYTDPTQFVTITTKLVGAEGDITGTITGGAVVEKDSGDYSVDWQLQTGDKDVLGGLTLGKDDYYYANSKEGDGKYVCYELERVVVDGAEQERDAEGNVRVPTDKNRTVEVYVRPVRHTVTIRKYGDGEVSNSKTVYHLDDYKGIYGKELNGSKLAKVVLDQGTPEEKALFTADGLTFDTGDVASQAAEPQAQADAAPAAAEAAPAAPQASAPVAAPAATDEPEAQAEAGTEEAAEEPAGDQVVPIDPEADAEPVAADSAEATPARGLLKDFRFIMDVYRPNAGRLMTVRADAEGTYTNESINGLNQIDISKDHTIDFYFVKQAKDPEGNPKTDPEGKPVYEPVPDADELVSVTAQVVGGEGTVEGNATVKKGEGANVKVTVGNKYEVVSVKDQDGKDYTLDENGVIQGLDKVDRDTDLTVTIKPKTVSGNNDPKPNEFEEEDPGNPSTYTVTASTQGGVGSISGAGQVVKGDSRTVSWTPGEGESVKYVFVDNVSRPDLVDKGQVEFPDVDSNHHVTVVFASNPNNVDKDNDGKPDVNVDPDNDGDPDTNVDTDGDGDPDTNIDPDGDGKPDLNVDPDGDGKPDTNIVDEDGDGEPDPVPDPKNPPKPTVNVDPDGDGKPDLNVDTDGDGRPDVNIVDEDGDGKPDPVDPKNPPKPNVNVDTDDDGKPDVNVDKDGDGKPDINIVDEDGDGVPDPVDPKNPPKPTVNVDTDGDGWPDINIDTDGDGRPDKNVDTNDDRVYDWKDEGHPQHQQYLDSLKTADGDGSGAKLPSTGGTATTSTSTRFWRLGNGLLPKTGDVASVAGIAASLAAAAVGATALVSRKRKK